MSLRTVLLIASLSCLLCFINANNKKENYDITLLIGNEKCSPGKKDGDKNDLVIDKAVLIVYDKNTRKIMERLYNTKTFDEKQVSFIAAAKHSRDTVDVAMVLYVRRKLGLRGDNEIYYGYNPENLRWHESPVDSVPTTDGSEWKVQPFHIEILEDKQKEKKNFDCEDPTTWIANHGIYKVTVDGAVENLYYDPTRVEHEYFT